MSTATAFDLDAFTRAIEQRDASTQLAMYAEDAEVTLADSTNQPRSPRVLHNKGEIQAWVEEVCARDMTHDVRQTVRDDRGVAFTEACRYPDGTNVLCASLIEIKNGLIASQIGVQAWDE